jgi:hypothetical protein
MQGLLQTVKTANDEEVLVLARVATWAAGLNLRRPVEYLPNVCLRAQARTVALEHTSVYWERMAQSNVGLSAASGHFARQGLGERGPSYSHDRGHIFTTNHTHTTSTIAIVTTSNLIYI